ncbi:MAG: endolytic transglycosylase MltG [bacterium]|nr:endolytic transglycosylase MltG [bacterium]
MIKKLKKIIIILLIAAILPGLAVSYHLNSPPALMQEEIFTVKNGETLNRVAYNLKKNNLVKNRLFFRLLAYPMRKKHIKTGRYRIFANMTSVEIFKKLTSGKILTREITIPEGFNIYQVAVRLEKNKITKPGKFLYYAFNKSFLESIKIYAPSVEGYLFPDTYVFPEESDARDIIGSMHNKMKKVLKNIDIPHEKRVTMDWHKILTLASLVEKEAQIPSERIYVSSVFHNRIEENMRMDCDPTVRYAVKKFTGRITYRDLAFDSPYNTYVRKGLPPTPICSPGKDALRAAISPKETEYLYFVARNDGSHYFSKSLREHNRAVRFYQRNEQNGFIDNQRL